MLWALIAYLAHAIEMGILSYAVKDIGPLMVMPIFFLFTFIFLSTNNFIRGKKLIRSKKADIKLNKLILSTYIGGALFGNVLWFSSLYFIGIGTITFILTFIRIFITAYSYFYMNDKYPADKITAIITTFVALLAYSFGGEFNHILGVTLAVISCIGFTFEGISRKKLALTEIKPQDMVLIRSIVLFTITLGLMFGLHFLGISEQTTLPSIKDISIVALAALFGGVFANVFVLVALKTMQLSHIEALNATKPITMTLIGIATLGETITSFQIAMGTIIIIASLYFLWPNKKQKKS